jgi:hypothetical protein
MNWKDFNIPQIGLAGGTPLWMDRARRIPARRAQNGDRTSGRLRKRTASSEYRYTYACMLAAVAPVRVTPRLRPVGASSVSNSELRLYPMYDDNPKVERLVLDQERLMRGEPQTHAAKRRSRSRCAVGMPASDFCSSIFGLV